MAFCTECGFKLPEDAVFCPNCGSSVSAVSAAGKASGKTAPEDTETGNSNPIGGTSESGINAESTPFQKEEAFHNTTQENHSASAQGAFSPPTQGSYSPQPQNTRSGPYTYGYPPPQDTVRTTPAELKNNGGKIAAIVISAAVILLALAVFLIYRVMSGNNSYIGYWESSAVDIGDGKLHEDYSGENVEGILGIQINGDGSAFLASALNDEIVDGEWKETDDGIQVINKNDIYYFSYKDRKLFLKKDDVYIVFEKTKGDINHPSTPRGSLSGSGGLLDTNDKVNTKIAGSGYVGSDRFYIEVIGATHFTDVDGDPAMRVYFEFTNDFKYSLSAWDALDIFVKQDGNELQETYSWEEADASYNIAHKIRPGVTIQCCYEFKYDPSGSGVDFTVYAWDEGKDGGTVSATYIPGELPGAPAPYDIKPVEEPQWTINLPGEGTLDDYYYVSVLGAELIYDVEGEPAVRVYYEFTNNSSKNVSLSEVLYTYAYQDGISLDVSYAYEDTDTDLNYDAKIAPGTTIKASCVFALRNPNSPVEAEIEAFNTFDAVGQTYEIS
ncbi:MAG: DUF5067 domain-containing protein [Clostridiales bacterium]|jgi:hypothetical protein|nr:DUF5067 domain-containing protein [Clostridiales bacterium]